MADVIVDMNDSLGDAYIRSHTAAARRKTGSTYTPQDIVRDMVSLAASAIDPEIVVDCGCGSGRFSIECAITFPKAKVIAIDKSREACDMCRRNASDAGLADRIDVLEADFMDLVLPEERGRVLWIGNPPYVRHHDIPESEKRAFCDKARALGLKASQLSGLHMHFLAQIAVNWKPGDFGVLVTSAEWLDVNYGFFPKSLLLERLPLNTLELYDRSERVFETAMTTAVVMSFGQSADIVRTSVHGNVTSRLISKNKFTANKKWSPLIYGDICMQESDKLVRLGSIASVHRGVVTGCNKFWVRRHNDLNDVPDELYIPVVSHAREIMGNCIAQSQPEDLSRLIVLPKDLGSLEEPAREYAEALIAKGVKEGVNTGYVASHRTPWWSIKPSSPPAIMMTYMARKSPTFVVNKEGLTMLNVVHGIYPKERLSDLAVSRLTEYLNSSVNIASGRTYCGGLTKFEPREAENLFVPSVEELERV